jgi:hypothetical protein
MNILRYYLGLPGRESSIPKPTPVKENTNIQRKAGIHLQFEWDLKSLSRVCAVDGMASELLILLLLQLLWFQVEHEAIFIS